MWDPRALVRVKYPKQNKTESPVEEIVEAAQSPKPQPEPLFARTTDECYNLDYPVESADDLMATLTEETQNIIVTVWFENYQNLWAQNMMNQNVRGTLWRCICKKHKDVIYSEADLSHYNRYAYTYEDMAVKLDISVEALFHGPTVAIMHDQSGMTFRTDDDPDKLLRAVDEYLRSWEKQLYGIENPACDFNDKNIAENHYEFSMPYGNLEMYDPDSDETNHQMKATKNVAVHEKSEPAPNPEPAPAPEPAPQKGFSLSEPSKAFT